MTKLKTINLMLFLFAQILIAQNANNIEGYVLNGETDNPVSKVNIVIQGTEFGTTTNENGYFSIIWNDKYPIRLVFTHIGYENFDLTVIEPSNVNVRLKPTVIAGDEVIIEGVLRHSEREVSSKVEVVELDKIETRGIRDASEIFAEFEGVNTNTTAYGNQTISIRGSNANEIAVYLDGIKLNNSATGSADLAHIDLADLDNIEVLKGSSPTLFGSGNFGGVVLMHSKKPVNNSLELGRGFGITDENDQDLSGAGSVKFGPIGLYGRYSGKSRLFDGRTLFTSIFGNYGGLLSFKNQEIILRHVDYNKYIEFPSGGVVSSDELYVNRFTFYGNLLNIAGWDIQIGQKKWSWDDSFFSNLTRKFDDTITQYRINKGFKLGGFSGSVQYEDEQQDYAGNQLKKNLSGVKASRAVGELTQHDRGIAGVLRYDVVNPSPNFSKIRWEGGIRYSELKYSQKQTVSDSIYGRETDFRSYNSEDTIPLNTYRFGVFTEGKLNDNNFEVFFSQGFNNRAPSMNNRFNWVDGMKDLQEQHQHLLKLYNEIGSDFLANELSKIKRAISLSSRKLEKELVSSSEINGKIGFNNITNESIDNFEFGLGVFRNAFTNKIAYITTVNNIIIPYNTGSAWLNGFELSGAVSAFSKLVKIRANYTWVQPSDNEIFSNKPGTTSNIIFDFTKNWFHLNISHLYNGPQNYLRSGVSIEQLKSQKNTNLTVSASKSFWYIDAILSYTIRNIFSDEVTILTAGTQTGDIFNYYDAHRKLINLKITLSDRK